MPFALFSMAFYNPGEQDFLGFEVGPLKIGPRFAGPIFSTRETLRNPLFASNKRFLLAFNPFIYAVLWVSVEMKAGLFSLEK